MAGFWGWVGDLEWWRTDTSTKIEKAKPQYQINDDVVACYDDGIVLHERIDKIVINRHSYGRKIRYYYMGMCDWGEMGDIICKVNDVNAHKKTIEYLRSRIKRGLMVSLTDKKMAKDVFGEEN